MKLFSLIIRHKWKVLAALVILLIAGGVFALTRPKQPEYVTATATRGDLKQTVEAVGTIISERDLQLEFPISDIVSEVRVKEGDSVRAGQRLASLRSGSLAASVASASANVQSALAQLRALQEGSRPENIAVAEAEVANRQASLDAARQSLKTAEDNLKSSEQKILVLKQEASINLSGEILTASSTVAQHLSTAKTVVRSLEGVFAQSDVQDVIIKNQFYEYEYIRSEILTLTTSIQNNLALPSSPTEYSQALSNLKVARGIVASVATLANRSYDFISTIPTNSSFTETRRETHKSSIATQKTAAQASLSALDSALSSLQSAVASYDTRIAAEESTVRSFQAAKEKAQSDIRTFESALAIQQAQLALIKAPARKTDIDAAAARVRQAQADLARSSAQLRDAQLIAPVDGIITKVNVKVGELKPLGPAITMIGNAPYRVEMYVSEVDIPKVRLTQSGSIELDAFRGTNFALQVSEVDPAATDRDGVSKYRVKLDFRYRHDNLKIGMTGDAAIITGERNNVISVPQKAVLERDDGTKYVRIQLKDNSVEERTVTTGMEGEGGALEVTGIDEGAEVIVLVKK